MFQECVETDEDGVHLFPSHGDGLNTLLQTNYPIDKFEVIAVCLHIKPT